jgi:hypothetical protein
MRTNRKTATHDEPIGIVIADGGAHEPEPRFLAYVWGPVPDTDEAHVTEGLLAAAAH